MRPPKSPDPLCQGWLLLAFFSKVAIRGRRTLVYPWPALNALSRPGGSRGNPSRAKGAIGCESLLHLWGARISVRRRAREARLITDMPNERGLPDCAGFREHRHDQSLFEQPPTQPSGGGNNSSLTVTLPTPLQEERGARPSI